MNRNSLVQKYDNEQLSIEQIREYKEIFDILDRSKIGIISVDDIIMIRRILYYPISQININKIIKEVDILEDGKFDFKNFVAFMQKQIEYIKETDENIIIKDIKDEIKKGYLGNKRKREKINENNNLKYKKNKYSKEKNKKINNNLLMINEESVEEKQNFSSDSSWNNKKKNDLERNLTPKIFWGGNKKKKLDNQYNNIQINKSAIFENLNVKMIVGKNKNNNNFNDKNNQYNALKINNNDINTLYNHHNEKRKRKKSNKGNNSKNDLMPINPTMIIMKKDLPQELVNQIEHKNNNNFISQISCNNINNYINNNINNYNNNNINNINNSFNLSSDFGSIPKRYNIIDGNFLDEYPLPNDLNIDSINKTIYSGYSYNSRLCRIPTIKSNNKNRNYIDDFTHDKFNEDRGEKIVNFPYNNNNNIFVKKNFTDLQNKNQLDFKSENSMNNSFYYFYNENNNFGNNIYLNGGIDIYDSINCDNKYANEYKPNNYINVIENNKINMTKVGKKTKSQEKSRPTNFQILNTFLFEYKRNRRKDKIIQKSIEIPYSIIIEKKYLNMREIENSLPDEHINFLNKDKSFSFSLKVNRANNLERSKDNKNMPFFL